MAESALTYLFRSIGAGEVRDEVNSIFTALGRNGEVSAASADKSAGAFALMRKGLTGVAGAAVAFGGAFAGFEAIKTGLNTQQSQDQLKAVTEQAHLSAQAFGHLDAAAVKTSQSGGFGANTERDALIQLVGASKSATTAIKGNSAAIALARGTSLSYSSAVSMVSNALAGRSSRLSKYLGYIAPVTKAEHGLTDAYSQQAAVINNSGDSGTPSSR